MKLNGRNLKPLGFKGNDMFQSKTCLTLHHRVVGNQVQFCDGIYGTVGVFNLTPEEMKEFKSGKLRLTPPGFCNASGGKSKTTGYKILRNGEPRSKKHLEQIFKQ